MKYDDPDRKNEDPDPRASQNHRTVATNPISYVGDGHIDCDNCEREDRKRGAEFFIDEWHQMCDLCLDALAYQLWLNGLGKKWKRRTDRRTVAGGESTVIFTTNNQGDFAEECRACCDMEQEFGYMTGLSVQHIEGVCIECWDALAYQLRSEGYGHKKPIERGEKQRATVATPPADGTVELEFKFDPKVMPTINQQAFGVPQDAIKFDPPADGTYVLRDPVTFVFGLPVVENPDVKPETAVVGGPLLETPPDERGVFVLMDATFDWEIRGQSLNIRTSDERKVNPSVHNMLYVRGFNQVGPIDWTKHLIVGEDKYAALKPAYLKFADVHMPKDPAAIRYALDSLSKLRGHVRGASQVGDFTLQYRYDRDKRELRVWGLAGTRIPKDAVNFLKARGYEYHYIDDNWTVDCSSEGLLSHMLPGYILN